MSTPNKLTRGLHEILAPTLGEALTLVHSRVAKTLGATATASREQRRLTFNPHAGYDVAWDGLVRWERPGQVGTHAWTVRVDDDGKATAQIFWGHYAADDLHDRGL